MAITRFQFQGCPAYLKQVLGERRCEAWLWKSLMYDAKKFVTLDLALTPKLAAAAAVEVDDHVTDGGATTLGPCWPGATCSDEGAVYLIQERWDEYHGRGLVEPVPKEEKPWQTQLRVVIERKAGTELFRRYHGFAAKLHQHDGAHAAFQVWCFNEPLVEPGHQLWLDLDDRAQCDEVDLSSPDRDGIVALFLSYEYAGRNGLTAVKIPRGLGEGARFERR